MEARDPIETDASDEPYKKALRLEYFTLAYNVAEAAASATL